jgi:hypothetical protein
MVTGGASAAAQASTAWMTRRVRVATLAHATPQNNDHKPPPQLVIGRPSDVVFKPKAGLARLTPVNVLPQEWLITQPRESIADFTTLICAKIRERYDQDVKRTESELEALNKDVFWSKYSSLQELASVEYKQDILKIIQTFQFVGKKQVYVLSQLSRKIIANRHDYTVEELGNVMHAFAQLGFLEESFCLQLSAVVIPELAKASPQTFVLVADAFATTRCFHSEFVERLVAEAPFKIYQFNVSQVSLLLSALARLNVRNEPLFTKLGNRLMALTDVFSNEIFSIPEKVVVETNVCSAGDVTLTAYAFAKMKITPSHKLVETMVSLSKHLVRDFTAKELQMLMTALDRFDLKEVELFSAVSSQAQRRIAQFSSETLVHFLKAMTRRSALDSGLSTRVVCHLPRMVNNMKASEIVGMFDIFRENGLKSQSGIEALRSSTVSKAGQFSSSDWLSILGSVVEVASPEVVSEFVDAFVLVNASPANYRSSTNIINATVMSRMTNQQIVNLMSICAKINEPSEKLTSLVLEEIQRRSWSSSDASDAYCVLVKMNMHSKSECETVMRNLLAKALDK